MEGKIEVTRRRERRRKQVLGDLKEKTGHWKDTERRSTRSHSPQNLVWNRLWTARNTDYMITMMIMIHLRYVISLHGLHTENLTFTT